ncbi:GTPase-activating protein [Desulfuromonas sp. KJ2020]|uniref:GTPase-activating protein n=1 Tax=Desulfuromonas sp. KJ2020 TaxID=2919173 RepID=UPI0003242F0C|nr:GTPase-activating protein [Desulfuromonas sp. KJ2020]MCP3177028.1 GTPase-activating protein [Desulfuromonas sp. KJ2020]
MILLPRGNPVKEKLNPAKVNLPDALGKLHEGHFTGYLRFDTPAGVGILIFHVGKLISALYETGHQRLTGYQAIGRIFSHSRSGEAMLDIYRLSAELAMGIHALLHGEVLYRGQELRFMDIRLLLNSLKEDAITGCLRIYTDNRVALIFYREGQPLGFFHDGSKDLEKTVDTSLSVARLPGAKVDVLTSNIEEEDSLQDLMDAGQLTAIWHLVLAEAKNGRRPAEPAARRKVKDERNESLLIFLQGVAEQHLGKIGAYLVEKAFEELVPGSEDSMKDFFAALGRSASLTAATKDVEVMQAEMSKGIQAVLSRR